MSGAEDSASTFTTLVCSLGSNAMLHLGALPNADSEALPPSLPLARQTIEILAMLQEKTKGNLTAEEAALVEKLLVDLRLRYVQASRAEG